MNPYAVFVYFLFALAGFLSSLYIGFSVKAKAADRELKAKEKEKRKEIREAIKKEKQKKEDPDPYGKESLSKLKERERIIKIERKRVRKRKIKMDIISFFRSIGLFLVKGYDKVHFIITGKKKSRYKLKDRVKTNRESVTSDICSEEETDLKDTVEKNLKSQDGKYEYIGKCMSKK